MAVDKKITNQYKAKLDKIHGSYKEIERLIKETKDIHYNTVLAMESEYVVEVAKQYLDEYDAKKLEEKKKFQLK